MINSNFKFEFLKCCLNSVNVGQISMVKTEMTVQVSGSGSYAILATSQRALLLNQKATASCPSLYTIRFMLM